MISIEDNQSKFFHSTSISKESDISFWPVRYDISDETVNFRPAVGEGMVQIMSNKYKETESDSEVTSFLGSISLRGWIMIALFTYITYKVLQLALRKKKKHLSPFSPLKWSFMGLFFNEGLDVSSKFKQRLSFLVTLILVFYLTTLFDCMFNTSLVVKEKPFVVDSLDDLLQTNLRPMFFRSDPSTTNFPKDKNEVLRKVWKKAVDMGIEKSYIDLALDPTTIPKQMKLMSSYVDTGALIARDLLIDAVDVIYCNVYKKPSWVSRQSILKMPFGGIMSKNCSICSEQDSADNSVYIRYGTYHALLSVVINKLP